MKYSFVSQNEVGHAATDGSQNEQGGAGHKTTKSDPKAGESKKSRPDKGGAVSNSTKSKVNAATGSSTNTEGHKGGEKSKPRDNVENPTAKKRKTTRGQQMGEGSKSNEFHKNPVTNIIGNGRTEGTALTITPDMCYGKKNSDVRPSAVKLLASRTRTDKKKANDEGATLQRHRATHGDLSSDSGASSVSGEHGRHATAQPGVDRRRAAEQIVSSSLR